MRIRATVIALALMTAPALAADLAPHVPTADEKAAMLDQIDQRINTMSARVMGILTSLHDNVMSLNAANLKASDDLAAANAALDTQKTLVAELTKEREELKGQLQAALHGTPPVKQ